MIYIAMIVMQMIYIVMIVMQMIYIAMIVIHFSIQIYIAMIVMQMIYIVPRGDAIGELSGPYVNTDGQPQRGE